MLLLFPTVFYCIRSKIPFWRNRLRRVVANCSKISKRENRARKRAALFIPEQTYPRSKKMGVFPNGPKLNYPSAAVVRHYGTGQRTLAMLHF